MRRSKPYSREASTRRPGRAMHWGPLCLAIVAAQTLVAVAPLSHASEHEIVLGMSTALTGPAAHLGKNMRDGVLAGIRELNLAGGVGGRTVRLVALDDGYEPSRTVPNMHALIEEENVLAVVGNVGTPTAVAAIPMANGAKVPFFGAFTGAGVLRKTPPDRYVVNYRASYAEETAAMVDALVEHGGLRPEEIAFFTQRDAYGDAGYAGAMDALRRHGLQDDSLIAHGRYERNSLAVESALAEMLLHEPSPKAVILVGTYGPCAEFIKLARTHDLQALFLNVSFAGGNPLCEALGPRGEGVVITQVVPHYEASIPVVREYRQALSAFDADTRPSFGSLEGYIVIRILAEALKTFEGAPSREGVVDALEALGDFDIGLGEPLHLGPHDHQACHGIWPTVIRDGRVAETNWQALGASLRENTK